MTGGAGFIGSHLVDRLVREGFEVKVIDDLSSGVVENIQHHMGKKDFHFVQGDIRNFDLVKRTVKEVDIVFHEAAISSWMNSWESLSHVNQVNVKGTLTLLKACIDSNVRRLIYASSAAIYGETGFQLQHEELTPKPISPYGVSKLSAEQYVQVFHKLYGLETVCLRYFNVYGLRQPCGPYCGVIVSFINRISRNESPIIYGDGEQTRDFVNVEDVMNASMLALAEKSAIGEVFNVGTGVSTSVNELADTLRRIMNKTGVESTYVDSRPSDIQHSCADINKAKRVLGYDPKIPLKDGLSELIGGVKVHQNY